MVYKMSLTHTEILQIIETCKGHVRSLKVGKSIIEVEFIVPQQPINTPPTTHNLGQEETTLPISDEQNLMKDLVEADDAEKIEKQRLIDELSITNPSQYEDMIALGEIVNAEKENDSRS
jgi:hypothetical protein